MIPKSGNRFSEEIILKQNVRKARWINLDASCSSGTNLTFDTHVQRATYQMSNPKLH